MSISRRLFVVWMGALAPGSMMACIGNEMNENTMYGLIGKIVSVPGKRDELARILIGGVSGMPGCLSYVVANDLDSQDALWVTEVWESKSRHQESLALDSVKEAIAKGRPMIAGFAERFETEPLGGSGI
jgi:quinol monooxygenase YgiN